MFYYQMCGHAMAYGMAMDELELHASTRTRPGHRRGDASLDRDSMRQI